MTARRLSLCLVVLSLATACPAAAQSASAPGSDAPATAKAAAQESYARGNKLFNQAEQKHDRALYEAAYLQFTQAYAIFHDDKILWNVILTEMETGRYVEGLNHLHDYDKRPHARERSGQSSQLAPLLEQAMKATGHLTIQAPAGATVRLDGAVLGPAPLPEAVDVRPGLHQVEATLAGGQTLHATSTPAPGEQVQVTLVEPPPAPAPAVDPGPQAPSPQTAPAPSDVAPTNSWWTTRHVLGVGSAALAVTGVALGTGFIIASNDTLNQVSLQRASLAPGACHGSSTSTPGCANLQDKTSAANTDATIALVSFIVGGLAGATSVALLAFGPSDPPAGRSGSMTWTPVLGLNSVGVAGHF